ncbi:related to ankyrin [Fusarium torulosum]|uniref:Related to ankyrin n=1 Tax=Fusarium torulosum TaxID=33205 RepID=A0AAE8SNU8_9HYPO|nr:related to ankyrin [Fusarium torulosum]
MPTPAPLTVESPYRKFTRKPEQVPHPYGYRTEHLTITDRDGSTLYETYDRALYEEIFLQDDVETLEKYFAVEPVAIPKIYSLPDDDEGFFDLSLIYLNALTYGSLGIIQLLVSYELEYCDSKEKIRFDRVGFQLLTEAARWGHFEMVQFFLDNQPFYADIHDRDWVGNTALLAVADLHQHKYVRCPTYSGVRLETTEAMMNFLLDRGACAADVVLLSIDPHETPRMPETVLTLAAKWSSPEIIKRLIDCGANVHAKFTYFAWDLGFYAGDEDFHHATALFVACLFDNSNAVKILIDCRGDNVDISDMLRPRDTRGLFPIHWASQNHMATECRDVPESGFQERAEDTISTIGVLLEYDPTLVNIQDDNRNTPLHHAVYTLWLNEVFYTSILKFLCDKGADASICNEKGQTPLHILFCSTHTSLPINVAAVSILLTYGASPTTADVDGNTPVHLAAVRLESVDAMSFLLENGGDASQRNLKQETALDRVAIGTLSLGAVKSEEKEITKAREDMVSILTKAGEGSQ